MKLSKEINGWLMLLVVLVTAGITSWVMLKDKPGQDWNSAYYYPPQQVARNFSPGIMAMNRGGLLVAGTTEIPVIRAGAVPPHADCGVCSNCHTVVSSRGNPIPNISATSTMPHQYRGVCSNCHRLANQSGLNTNMVNSQVAIPVAAVGQVVAPRATAPARMATEGEWLGLEVVPITPFTASQYGIPYGTRGLVIAETEAQALTAGLKAGDVVLSVNGTPISNMTNFFQATWNGTLTKGMVEVLRKGRKLAVNIPQTTNQALAATPNTVIAPRATAPARMATEGEWLGLEVVPITPFTASQYGIPYGTRGLVIAETEAQALTAGLKAGDVVLSVNGTPISNMTNFFQATWNGTLTKGMVEVLRKGRKLAVNLAQTMPPAQATVPNIPVNAPSWGMPTAIPTLQGNAAGWDGGQRFDNIQEWGPGVGSPKHF